MEGNPLYPRGTLSKILVFVAFLIGSMFIGNFLGVAIALPFTDFELEKLISLMNSPAENPEFRSLLLGMQGLIALITFVIAPYYFLKYFDLPLWDEIRKPSKNSLQVYLGMALIVVVFMPFSASFIELFQPENWPDSLRGLAESMESIDSRYDDIAGFFVDFDSYGEFFLAIIVMAVLPAIGEEFVFRGVLQPYLVKLSKNSMLGVLICSFIFAAFHMQFSGFFPRFLLGVIFGLIFLWTRNIWLPVLGHFLNNFITLLMAGAYQFGLTEVDMNEDVEISPLIALLSVILGVILMIWMRKATLLELKEPDEGLASGI